MESAVFIVSLNPKILVSRFNWPVVNCVGMGRRHLHGCGLISKGDGRRGDDSVCSSPAGLQRGNGGIVE